ncbi:hypothetical protein [uncultured Porticoccus sp.]|uniref:hypothetical protein n=1 Tax=uncultured Porticoccus sp. TaxID=1256050 RepID=UPI0026103116|nr:hypothetical protein [uncultured Porticoccus sp.]
MKWNAAQGKWKNPWVNVMEHQLEASANQFVLLAYRWNGETVDSPAPGAITNKLAVQKTRLVHWPITKIVDVEPELEYPIGNSTRWL